MEKLEDIKKYAESFFKNINENILEISDDFETLYSLLIKQNYRAKSINLDFTIKEKSTEADLAHLTFEEDKFCGKQRFLRSILNSNYNVNYWVLTEKSK